MNENKLKKFVFYISFVLFLVSCQEDKASILPKQPEREVLGTINDKRLTEISGLAVSSQNEGIIWVHNDSGNESEIYAVNKNGQVISVLRLKDKENYDWEDIAIGYGPEEGQEYIYISNTGDNFQSRKNYSIIRLKEPKIDSEKTEQVFEINDYDTINFVYPDKSHDCEALFIDNKTKDLYLITKRDSLANFYKLAYPQRTGKDINVAEFITQMRLGESRTKKSTSRICGADLSRNGEHVLVKSYDTVYYYKIDTSFKTKFADEPLYLHYVPEPQGEAIGFSPDNKYYYTISEVGPMNTTPVIYRYVFIEPKRK